jgi:methylphosphotriester-DNA--protein-cysteine methyltransferase
MSDSMGRMGAPDRLRVILDLVEHSLDESTVDGQQLDAGYGSPEAFARAFRRAYGCLPSDFRRALCRGSTEIRRCAAWPNGWSANWKWG